MEGSTLGRIDSSGSYPTEDDLEQRLIEILTASHNLTAGEQNREQHRDLK